MRIEGGLFRLRSLEPGMMERLEERRERRFWLQQKDGCRDRWEGRYTQKVSKSAGGRAHTAW